jgi:competence protein ComGC
MKKVGKKAFQTVETLIFLVCVCLLLAIIIPSCQRIKDMKKAEAEQNDQEFEIR